MLQAPAFEHFGGRHVESAVIKNLLAHAGVRNPVTREPFSEALCFGIAGGIGAGYSFCPSVPRNGTGSGVTIIGRHIAYATSAAWYTGCFERLGIKTSITETGGPGKAYQNLVAELEAGKPTVVWCSRARLPFLGDPMECHDLWMHSFIVHAVDETKGIAYGSDRASTAVSLNLEDLAAARNGICSHKNRTMTCNPPDEISPAKLQSAVVEGIRVGMSELLGGKMKTFSLPGLETWARMITNNSNKDGWLNVFSDGLMYNALRDVFDSIETNGTGGGLFRLLYAEFLDEAAELLNKSALAEFAKWYRNLGKDWTALADECLPDKVKPFKQTKALLRKNCKLLEEKGAKAAKQIEDNRVQLRQIEEEMKLAFPMEEVELRALLENLRERILALHAAETATATKLQTVV